MRITRQQFDTAVDLLQQGRPAWGDPIQQRITLAANFVFLVQQQSCELHDVTVDDIEKWTAPSPEEIAQFLAGLTLGQRRMLQRVAEDIVVPDERKLH